MAVSLIKQSITASSDASQVSQIVRKCMALIGVGMLLDTDTISTRLPSEY